MRTVRPGLNDPGHPLKGPVLAEVYRVSVQRAPVSNEETSYEVRLCRDCAKTADQGLLESIVRKRAEQNQTGQ